jgi:hypothetical protein
MEIKFEDHALRQITVDFEIETGDGLYFSGQLTEEAIVRNGSEEPTLVSLGWNDAPPDDQLEGIGNDVIQAFAESDVPFWPYERKKALSGK